MRRPWSLRLVRTLFVGFMLIDGWRLLTGDTVTSRFDSIVVGLLWLGWVPTLDELWGWKGPRW